MRTMTPGFRLLLVSSLIVAAPDAADAETITAANLTPEAVWKAIEAAKDGDTVQLPAGTAEWTKGWNTGHSAKMKAITIQGAGIDKTVILDRRSQVVGYVPFYLDGVEGKAFRVTGMTLDGTDHPTAGQWGGLMTIRGNCKNFRIDHCKFKNTNSMIAIDGDTYGLIDHCIFDGQESKGGGNVQPIKYAAAGAPNYRKPLSLGTAEAMYFEDNEVYIAPAAIGHGNVPWIAPNNGARVVIRHNKIVNSQIEIYDCGMNKMYGCQTSEIYDNEFSAVGVKQGTPQCFIYIGAGVNIVFNNNVTGTTYNRRVIELKNQRAYRDLPGFPKADGKNPIDGNQIPAGQVGAGYPCMGQIGRGTDVDGKGIFELSPCYAWNNTFNGAKLLMAVLGNDPNELAQIKEGRDFFNDKPPAKHYTPYVYPHPLQNAK